MHACDVGVSPCILHRFEQLAATFQLSLVSQLPIASNRCAPAAPGVLGAPPVARARSNRAFGEATAGRGCPKDATASLPAACGRPVTDTPKTRDLHQHRRSITQESRKFDFRDTRLHTVGKDARGKDAKIWGLIDSRSRHIDNPRISNCPDFMICFSKELPTPLPMRFAGIILEGICLTCRVGRRALYHRESSGVVWGASVG